MEDINKITHRIIACSMKVHNTLGNGFQEKIYQRALFIELQKAGLNVAREVTIPIHYEGIRIGARRVDFLIEDQIAVEIKAVIQLDNVHLAQAINYLEAFRLNTGLLINFGSPSLQFRRLRGKKGGR